MLRRGFKTWCENLSGQLRADLGLNDIDPLDARRLAQYMKVVILTPSDVFGLSKDALRILVGEESDGWSAVTIPFEDAYAVIYNPTHSKRRTSSNLMHELAHILIEHEPGQVVLSADGMLALRSFDRTQEEEAAWLSGCLLLPRPVLLEIEHKGGPLEEVCELYGVSNALLTYRRNITGVARQMGRRRTRPRA